ncbi:MAG TPA: hypothetical protein VJS43_10770 [Candidatus Acidoferrales bacterium]|nr:hypothetical protein [Candidatus Acidoferrales bacterium]
MSLPDIPKADGKKSVAQLIDQLSAHDNAVREHAAREIFALGLARVEPGVRGWLADPDLADCFIFDLLDTGARFPRTTVGVAVEPGRFTQIRAACGSPHLADVPADLDAQEFEICIGGTVRLDILTTRDRDADGAMARFLRKHGEGIQQVELSVLNVDLATQLLRERFGLAPVYPESRAGADRTRVNFFLVPVQPGSKLLIELVEEPT